MSTSRITIVDNVHYQSDIQQAISSLTRIGINLESEDQPFVRNQAVTSKWTQVETGWLTNCSYILFRNLADTLKENSSADKVFEYNNSILELGFSLNKDDITPLFKVYPGDVLRVSPTILKNDVDESVYSSSLLYIRSVNLPTRLLLTALPS